MAIDVNKLKDRLTKLQNGDRFERTELPLWKPKPGTSNIRIVPYLYNPDSPFIELYFHYDDKKLGKKGNKISLKCFGKEDPFIEESKYWLKASFELKQQAEKLKEEGNEVEFKKLEAEFKRLFKFGKSFEPFMRVYCPIIVRGEETKGVKFWSFGANIYEKLLKLISHPDYGDIADPETGFDLEVTFVPPISRKNEFANYRGDFSNNPYGEVDVTARRNPSLLLPQNADEKLADMIKKQQINILDIFKEPNLNDVISDSEKYTLSVKKFYDSGESLYDTAKDGASKFENKVETKVEQKTETKIDSNQTVSTNVQSKFRDLFKEEQ